MVKIGETPNSEKKNRNRTDVKSIRTWGGEERVRCTERVTRRLTLPYVK